MKSLIIVLGIVLMNGSAQASDSKWPPDEKHCPPSKDHLAIVVEHVPGSNNSISCKLLTGENYKTINDPSLKVRTDYIDCSKETLEINSLVLITKGYHEAWDILGNKRCMAGVGLVKVIGKVSY